MKTIAKKTTAHTTRRAYRRHHVKFTLNGVSKNVMGIKVWQIVSLENFTIGTPQGERRVKKGQVGGWIEGKRNLSHLGSCWIDVDAVVTGGARVKENAYVGGKAVLLGNSIACGAAKIVDLALLNQQALVGENATVGGAAWVGNDAKVLGSAVVEGLSRLSGRAIVSGTARIDGAEVGCQAVVTAGSYEGKRARRATVKISGSARLTTDVSVVASSLDQKIWICKNTTSTGGVHLRGDATSSKGKTLKLNGKQALAGFAATA